MADEKINISMNTVVVFIDMARSTDKKILHGDEVANRLIMQRLQDIEATLRMVDPAFKRISQAGDEIMCFAENAFALFVQAVKLQAYWMAWPTKGQMAARISIGMGNFAESADGDYRAVAIDITARIVKLCPEGKVVVTETVRAVIQAAGHDDKLIPMDEYIQGYVGKQRYYEVDGEYIRTLGSRMPAREKLANEARIAAEALAAPDAPAVAGPLITITAVDEQERKERQRSTRFWEGMALTVLLMIAGAFVYLVLHYR